MPPPETYKSEIGSQSTMCQVQTGAYVSLLTPGESKYSDCHPRKTTTYLLHVVSITTHTHDKRKPIGEKKQGKEKNIKEGKVPVAVTLPSKALVAVTLPPMSLGVTSQPSHGAPEQKPVPFFSYPCICCFCLTHG